MDFKIQTLNFSFTALNQELSASLQTDERFDTVEKISILSPTKYPAPATIQGFTVDGISDRFDAGLQLAHFQPLFDRQEVLIGQKLNTKRANIEVRLKDDTQGAFTTYKVQIAFYLTKSKKEV